MTKKVQKLVVPALVGLGRFYGSELSESSRGRINPGQQTLGRFCSLVALLLMVLGRPAFAQQPTPEETSAFTLASRAFQLGTYDIPEKEFADFVKIFPDSARWPEAILFQAQAALKQQRQSQAIQLLTSNPARAGLLADQY